MSTELLEYSGDSETQGNEGDSQSLIATDPKHAHTPSLAGSVIECQDEVGDRTLLIRIQNIASTANLGVRLDLKKIALKCRNTEFNPRRFGAVIMRLREPRATALIFASGKICVTGVKSTHNATLACKKFHYIIERVGFKVRIISPFSTVVRSFGVPLDWFTHIFAVYTTSQKNIWILRFKTLSERQTWAFPFASKVCFTRTRYSAAMSRRYESFLNVPFLYLWHDG